MLTAKYARPGYFLRASPMLARIAASAALLLFCVGLYLGLVASPPDYQQGEAVRIMYVHVPAAWMAMGVYGFMAMSSAVYLIWKHPIADVAARSAAPLGAVYTLICLLTGAIWGKPMWGAWWVWDARLTSVLILFFLYIGYMALAHTLDDSARLRKACAILALVGFANLPVIRFSVQWWNTLHQPASVIRSGGASIHDPLMLSALFVMAGAYLSLFIVLLAARMRTELLQVKIRRLADS